MGGGETETITEQARVRGQLLGSPSSPPSVWAPIRSSGLVARTSLRGAVLQQALYLDLTVEAFKSFHIRKPLGMAAFHFELNEALKTSVQHFLVHGLK